MPSMIEKIGQMLYVGFHGLTTPDYILEWLSEGRIGGVILFARNVDNPRQLADLTSSLHAAAKTPILISIDQEGGTVSRLRKVFTESPGSMALSSSTNAEALTERMSVVLGAELRALGINWDYAPVVDVTYNADNPTVGTRSFGKEAERIGTLASAMVRGLQQEGVAACAKHFPGLGDTAIDTHLALARIDQSVEHLLAVDLLPYRQVIDAGIASIMTTHTVFTALDETYPATLSPVIIHKLIREELGFQGVVCSDCMEMKAIADNFGEGELAVLGALAGLDAILISHTRSRQEAAMQALYEAYESGRLGEDIVDSANQRIATMKAQYAIELPLDISRIASKEHKQVAMETARGGVVMLRRDAGVFPLRDAGHVALIEFASIVDSEVMEQGGLTGLATAVQETAPFVTTLSLKSRDNDDKLVESALDLAAEANVLILVTRNAHLSDQQRELALRLADESQRLVVLCLRNPYDAALFPNAGTVVCTSGDATPSLTAVMEALQGEFIPVGVLPVDID
ncbi:MAG: beta-N-acetylhexosaminidase [Anaerolineae bacterium]|nr:beta-N-acetylhexosaminidase [Anaerolineae bacterium]